MNSARWPEALALGIFLLFPGTLSAGVNSWSSIGPDEAAIDYMATCESDPQTVFVISGRHLYRSVDRGDSWERLPDLGDFLSEVVINPGDSRLVYATTSRGLLKSSDRGDTWRVISAFIDGLVSDPRRPQMLYGARGNGLERSTDGGWTWAPVLFVSPSQLIAVDPVDSNVLYVATYDGLLKSVDGGLHFTPTGIDADVLYIDRGDSERLFAGNDGQLWTSTDGGQTWTELFVAPPAYPYGPVFPGINSIAVPQGQPNVLYLGTEGGLYKSTDAGLTWGKPAFLRPITRLAFLDEDPDKLTVATPDGVFKIWSGGTNWASSNSGFREGTFRCVITHPTAPDHLYAASNNQLFTSTDGGRHWMESTSGLDLTMQIQTVEVDPKDPSKVYLGTESNRVFKSTDHGFSWTASGAGMAVTGVRDLVIDPRRTNILYAAGLSQSTVLASNIYKSVDGGASWAVVNSGTPIAANSLAINPFNASVLYAATWQGAYKSTDAGVSWTLLFTPHPDRVPAYQVLVDPSKPQTIYAVGGSGVYRSGDSGGTWVFFPYSPEFLFDVAWMLQVDPRKPSSLYLGTGRGVLKSTDSGKSWRAFGPGLGDPDSDWVQDLRVSASGTVYASIYQKGIFAYEESDIIVVPRLVNTPAGETTGLALSNRGTSDVHLAVNAFDQSGKFIQGTGIVNPVDIVLKGGEQRAWLAQDLFGPGFAAQAIKGWLRVDGASPERVSGFFSLLTPNLSLFETATATGATAGSWLFSEIGADGRTELWLVNPNESDSHLHLELRDSEGVVKGLIRKVVGPGELLSSSFEEVFGQRPSTGDSVSVLSDQSLVGLECLTDGKDFAAAVGRLEEPQEIQFLFAPQYAASPGMNTSITVVNLDTEPGIVMLQLFSDDGQPVGEERELAIGGLGKIRVNDPGFFGLQPGEGFSGYMRIRSPWVRLTGTVVFADNAIPKRFAAALPLVAEGAREVVFSHLVSTSRYFTGVAILNCGTEEVHPTMQVLRADGSVLAEKQLDLQPRERRSRLLTGYFPELAGQDLPSGMIRIEADQDIAAFALFGAYDLDSLSALTADSIR